MTGAEAAPGRAGCSEDRLLGGRVRLRQPACGYRVAIDPVFLAASVPAEPDQLVLDIGCGAARRCCAWPRGCRRCRVVGLDMQRDLVRLAGDKRSCNGMAARVSVMVGDLLRRRRGSAPGAFDHVMANPPISIAAALYAAAAPGKAERPSRARPISAPGCGLR